MHPWCGGMFLEMPLTQTQCKQKSAAVSHPEPRDHVSNMTPAVHKPVLVPSREFFTALFAIHLRKSCMNAQKLTVPRYFILASSREVPKV